MNKGFPVFGFRRPCSWVQPAVWLLAAALLSGPASAATQPPPVLGVRQQLPNGLVWLFSEAHDLPLVTLQLLIKAGTLQEPAEKAGLANLTAQLLLSGTKKRRAPQIAQELDFLGAKLSAVGGDDYATVSLTVLKKDLVPGLDLLRDVLFNPAFQPEEIRRKVTQIKAALKSEEDEPGVVAARAFAKDLYGPFPYGRPVRGTDAGLSAIARQDLVAFHSRYWRPNNAILSLVGDLSREEAQKWVSETFGAWAKGPIPPPALPPIPALNEPQVVVINKDITQANIVLGNVGLARAHPDFYAFQVMNYILGGGGFASRLMDNIRENRGLAYSVASAFSPGLEPGPFSVVLETKNANAGEAVAQVLKEIERIRTQPVSAQELNDAKGYLIGSFPRRLDSMAKRAGMMSYAEFYGLGQDYPWRYPELIQHLTPADLQKVAEKYLLPDKYLLVVVGKKSEMPSFAGPPGPPKEERKKDEEKKSGS